MIEIIKHALGICGEHWHPNIFNISVLVASVSSTVCYIKVKLYNIYRKKNILCEKH